MFPRLRLLNGSRSRAVASSPPGRPEVAFVLPGGGSLGAAQVGMLHALLERGIRPDVLVGCSVGALNAAFVAMDPTLDQVDRLTAVWSAVTRDHVFGVSRRRIVANLITRQDHIYEPDRLLHLIKRFCPIDDLAETVVPVHVVTTDLDASRAAWWTSGDPRQVLYASSCLPGLFPPAVLGGSRHVDGGVLEPVPVQRAVDLGARTIYLLGQTIGPEADNPVRLGALDVLIRSFAISRYAKLPDPESLAGAGQRVLVIPGADTRGIDIRDFSQTERLMVEGYAAAREFLRRAA